MCCVFVDAVDTPRRSVSLCFSGSPARTMQQEAMANQVRGNRYCMYTHPMFASIQRNAGRQLLATVPCRFSGGSETAL